ncbi:MAG: hypothetical protein JWP89_274 [Schlesneria sp.]|nr:hypothetical protein [Schlesneria sp.]
MLADELGHQNRRADPLLAALQDGLGVGKQQGEGSFVEAIVQETLASGWRREFTPIVHSHLPEMATLIETAGKLDVARSFIDSLSPNVEAQRDDGIFVGSLAIRYGLKTSNMLRVNLLASTDRGLFVYTFDLYSARHRKTFMTHEAMELAVEEALRLLRDPRLLDRIVADIPLVGETTNKPVGSGRCQLKAGPAVGRHHRRQGVATSTCSGVDVFVPLELGFELAFEDFDIVSSAPDESELTMSIWINVGYTEGVGRSYAGARGIVSSRELTKFSLELQRIVERDAT